MLSAFAEIAEVEACHRIAGEGDYLLKIRARDTADLERVVGDSVSVEALAPRRGSIRERLTKANKWDAAAGG